MNTHGRRVAVGASAEGVISNTNRKLYATSLLLNFQVYRRIETMSYHSVAEWLACWTQAQKGPGSNRSRDAVG